MEEMEDLSVSLLTRDITNAGDNSHNENENCPKDISDQGESTYRDTELDNSDNNIEASPVQTREEILSKRQRRRLLKREKWKEMKSIRRAREKEKIKKKRAEAKLSNEPLNQGPSRKELKRRRMSLSECRVRVVLDLSFDHLMSEKDICKCVKQLNYCYSANRRSEHPVQFHVTGFSGASKSEMEKNDGYINWDVNFHPENYLDLFKKEDLIYLTSDSENVITEIDEGKVYIIGGLVDHNAHKGLCLRTAKEQEISHARLPIKEHLKLKTREVLTILHVFEILLLVISGTTWGEALLKVIPLRKGASLKEKQDEDGELSQEAEPPSQKENQLDLS